MAKKVCRKCKIFVEGPVCPVCKGNQFSDNWKGRMYLFSISQSEIAKKISAIEPGEYAIKVK